MVQQLRVDVNSSSKICTGDQLQGTRQMRDGQAGKPREHLKRLRLPMPGETEIQPNPKDRESVANQLRLTCPGALTHRATMDAAPLLTEAWRILRAEYVGSFGARLGNMVREVVCPRDQYWPM